MTSKMSKRIRARDEGVEFFKLYPLDQALELIREKATAKFDETVEVAFVCQIDPKKSDQNVRTMAHLPHATGKKIRIAVFAEGEQAEKALSAGADRVGGADLIDEVAEGKIDFNFCIATPAMMGQISKIGRILGPKGLMPNPKLGTVTVDVEKAIQAARQGQVALRADKAGIVHGIIGKVSFSEKILSENFSALYQNLLEVKPASVKKNFIKKVFISSTMGFGLALDLNHI
jgi:large subunit ribosomal protein L1